MNRVCFPHVRLPAAVWLVFGTLFGACTSNEHSVRPGINDEYQKQDVETWVGRFEAESREIFHERERIVEVAGVRQGMSVADIGAGTGFFTELFARRVGPGGRVYAVDITPVFIEKINERVRTQGLSRVTTILCTDRSTELPLDSIDLAFVCDTYHHFEFPKNTLRSIHRALRRGGILVVVDFERIPGKSRQWVMDHVRADRRTVTREIISEGFTLLDEPPTPWLHENYLLRFRRSP